MLKQISRVGLPKKTQTYFFFQIIPGKESTFSSQLNQLIPLITNASEAQRQLDMIAGAKHHGKGLLKLSGINIGFSRKGFTAVSVPLIVYKYAVTASNISCTSLARYQRSAW